MSKEKNKNTFRIGALLLVACLISSVMLSGTFAKYTSEYSGQDTALVARWSFTGNFDGQELDGTSIKLPIWDHNYSTNIYQRVSDGEGGWDYLIAPGIQGQFTVDFTYDADVNADLIFKFTKSGVGSDLVPLQYSLVSDFSTVYYKLHDLENAIIDTAHNGTISGSDGIYTISDTAESDAVTINKTVYWRWPYEVGLHDNAKLIAASFLDEGETWTDADDVIAGNSSQAANRDDYVLSLQIKATQKTPGVTAGTALTGIAAIGGVSVVGNTLEAGTLTPDLPATYQWQICNDEEGTYTNIAGATSNTYILVAGDATKYVRVVATATGTNAGTVTSTPVGPITTP